MAGDPAAVSILFVCLGNHCRSPVAHAIADAMSDGDQGVVIDSAATSRAHVGEPPHPKAVAEGRRRGYTVDHRARQIHPDDFARFDLVIAMDHMNVDDLERLRGGEEQRTGHYATVEPVQVQLLRRWDPYAMPDDEDLADPWGQPATAYSHMFDVVERTIPSLLAHLAWLRSEHPAG